MSRTAYTEAESLPSDDVARTDLQLAEAIALSESIDWRRVPGVSAVTAATWTRQLQEARAALEADRR